MPERIALWKARLNMVIASEDIITAGTQPKPAYFDNNCGC